MLNNFLEVPFIISQFFILRPPENMIFLKLPEIL